MYFETIEILSFKVSVSAFNFLIVKIVFSNSSVRNCFWRKFLSFPFDWKHSNLFSILNDILSRYKVIEQIIICFQHLEDVTLFWFLLLLSCPLSQKCLFLYRSSLFFSMIAFRGHSIVWWVVSFHYRLSSGKWLLFKTYVLNCEKKCDQQHINKTLSFLFPSTNSWHPCLSLGRGPTTPYYFPCF